MNRNRKIMCSFFEYMKKKGNIQDGENREKGRFLSHSDICFQR